MKDDITKLILKILGSAQAPLETKEIEALVRKKLPKATRTKVLYRLNIMRGDGDIKGKFVGPGKGVWIWWEAGVFARGGA